MLWHKVQGAGGVGGGLPVEIIGATSAIISTGSSLTSVSADVGDWFFVVDGVNGGTSATSPPALISGYTNIVASDGSSYRPVRAQYKVATSAGTETVTVNSYGFMIVVRNVSSVGQSGVIDSNTIGNPVALPNLTGLNTSNSLILAGPYFPGSADSNDLSSATSPYALELSAHAGGGNVNAYVSVVNNTNSSITGASISSSASLYNVSWAVELIGG